MIGIVEIYKDYGSDNQELIHKEENLIVDGAGEAIVDLFMTPSSIVSSVSGVNDTSNFTVQAISFGKAASAYTQYGHYWAPTEDDHFGTSSLITRIQDDKIMRVMQMSSTWSHGEDIQLLASSFMAPSGDRKMNSYPSPMDTVIEVGTDTAIDLSGGEFHYNSLGRLVPGKYEAVGHNLNVLPFDTAGSSIFRGCWPVSGTGSKAIIVSSLTYGHKDDVDGHGAAIYPNPQDAAAASATIYGGPGKHGYNDAGAMDMSGFVRAYHLCLGELGGIKADQSLIGITGGGAGSGLLVSAQEGAPGSPIGSPLAVPAFAVPGNTNLDHIVGKTRCIDNCEVIYVTKLSAGDLGYSNLFGGITTLGLWTIDLDKTLDGLSATAHTETDNLLYYSASGNPYHFGNQLNGDNRGWLLSGIGASAEPVSGNQRDPYGGHAWQVLQSSSHGGTKVINGASATAKVLIPEIAADTSADYTFSVYFQGYQNVATSNVGIHLEGENDDGFTYGNQLSGTAWGQRGSLSAIGNAIDDGEGTSLNDWTKVTHTARFGGGTDTINCHIVLSSMGWGANGTFYDLSNSIAVSHAKLEQRNVATDFVAGRVEYPPFRFKNENNPLKYKLFAKRTLTNTLTAIKDKSIILPGAAGYQDLTIVWRIKFS